MNRIKKQVLAEVEKAWPRQVAHLQALVREPSVLGNEAGAQRLVAGTYRQLGLEVTCFEPALGALARQPGFLPPEWGYRGRPNVVAKWRAASSGGRSLVLNGHVDVVSPEPVAHWSYDPWGAEIIGDRLYGRGALDMKAGLGGMAFAVRALQAAGVRLKGDVILQSAIEEECTGNGTIACLQRGFVADGCVIPEPSGGRAVVAQVGVLWGRLRVRGVAGHVSQANYGINAIEKTYLLIRALRQLEERLNADKHPAFKDTAWPINFNPGVIRGGDWPSSVPALCELEFRMAFYPGTSAEAAQSLIRQQLLASAAADPWLHENPPEVDFYGLQAEGVAIDPSESPVIRTLAAAHEEVTGRTLMPAVTTATNDARFFLLNCGIPATCYGPAGANLHGVDEYVELPTVLEATKVIATFVMDWCGVVEQ